MKHSYLWAAAALIVATATPALAQPSPYAGQEARAIKSLSQKEIADIRGAEGMGLAKAAELNGYPGPAHVLENADQLALSGEQRRSSAALMQEHKARARVLGAELLNAEQALDDAFARKSIDTGALTRLTADIGRRQASLREEHLRTHLLQTGLLTPEQIGKYQELRGYAAPSPQQGIEPGNRHLHKH
jgi:hypothetical protein